MKVLATRKSDEGYKVRRILLDDGKTKDWTIEVPLTVWRYINSQGRANNRALQQKKTMQRRVDRAAAIEQLRQGVKPIAIAHQIGVHTRTVERWRKELNV